MQTFARSSSLLLLFLSLVPMALSGCTPINDEPIISTSTQDHISPAINTPPTIKIGFCPTMQDEILELKKLYKAIVEINYPSAGAAFVGLYEGEVDAIIVGRTANSAETSGELAYVRKQDGFTLISSQPGMIYYDDLVRITIHTAARESDLAGLLPPGTNVIYHESLAEALIRVEQDAVLVRWSQVLPSDKLLIPVDKTGNKIGAFRSPHLYFLDKSESKMEGLIDAFMP